MKRILWTGGGTGGHIYPLIAVAEELKKIATNQSIEVGLHYIGPINEYSARLAKEGISVAGIANAKFRRYGSVLNIIDGVKFLWSLVQALIKVGFLWPHAAFSKGGPGALPVLLACALYRVPIIIHESDAVPGLTNRVTSRFARKIELGWKETRKFFPRGTTAVVGIPLRATLLNALRADKSAAKKRMGCTPENPVLLVLGGSQGSQRINNIILKNLKKLLEVGEIIHQIGVANFKAHQAAVRARLKTLPEELRKKYHPVAYLEETVGDAYAATDCVLSRSGSVIFEIAAFGIPAILIPFPEAASNHQLANARAYVKAGGAILIEERNLTMEKLLREITNILANPAWRETMGNAARAYAKLNTSEIIARDILKIVVSEGGYPKPS